MVVGTDTPRVEHTEWFNNDCLIQRLEWLW